MTNRPVFACFVALMAAAIGCAPTEVVVHLIPEGYVGPIVIVYGDEDGVAPEVQDDGRTVYRIPRSGVLRLNSSPPRGRLQSMLYFYEGASGSRELIEADGGEHELKVFGEVSGSASGRESEVTHHWFAYVVGVRSKKSDWTRLRGEATSAAVGLPGLQ